MAFFNEAISQWDAGLAPDSLATLVALQFLSLTATFLGQGDKGMKLLQSAVTLGKRLNLLYDGPPLTIEPPPDEDDLRAASHCAWGLFSYATYVERHSLISTEKSTDMNKDYILSIVRKPNWALSCHQIFRYLSVRDSASQHHRLS